MQTPACLVHRGAVKPSSTAPEQSSSRLGAGVVAVGVVGDVVRRGDARHDRGGGGVAEGVAVGVGIERGEEVLVGVTVAVVVEAVAGGLIVFVARDRPVVRLPPAPDTGGVLGADLHGAGAYAGLHVRRRRIALAHVLRVHLPAPVRLPAAALPESDEQRYPHDRK